MTSRKKLVGNLRSQVQTAQQAVSGKEPELARPAPNSPAKKPAQRVAGPTGRCSGENTRCSKCEDQGWLNWDLAQMEEAGRNEIAMRTVPWLNLSAAPLSEGLRCPITWCAKTIEDNAEVKRLESQLARGNR